MFLMETLPRRELESFVDKSRISCSNKNTDLEVLAVDVGRCGVQMLFFIYKGVITS